MAVKERKQTARSSRKKLSYRETSSEDSDSRPRKKTRLPQRPSGRHQATSTFHEPSVKPKIREHNSKEAIPSDGIVPAWSSLPYDILLATFLYASHPLRNEVLSPTPSISWLVNAARTCTAFRGPALAALYQNPPLFHLHQPHNLLSLLVRDPASWSINYRAAIKDLELNTMDTLAFKFPGRGLMDLSALVRQLPQLRLVNITESTDRLLYSGAKWHYPATLFSALDESGAQLRSWSWKAFLLSKKTALDLEQVHSSSSFAGLTDLTLSEAYLIGADLLLPIKIPHPGIPLPALKPLKCLSSLTLENCSAYDWQILQELPVKLNKLIIRRTENLDSQAVRSYLRTWGSNLTVLELSHNKALDLTFLPSLSESCPRLDMFVMDLTFFKDKYHDSDPLFDSLMGPADIPTWPSSLRKLELCYLRKWDARASENFFNSLTNSAANLKFLRHLVIKASIDIDWRNRAGFRDRWISRLQHVFKRRVTPPAEHLQSMKTFRLYKQAQAEGRQPDEKRFSHPEQSSGSQVQPRHSARRSRRYQIPDSGSRMVHSVGSAYPDSDVQVSPTNERYGLSDLDVQGLCETVDIAIDNQRPVEQKFNNDDFMDSERSGDEDYID